MSKGMDYAMVFKIDTRVDWDAVLETQAKKIWITNVVFCAGININEITQNFVFTVV